MDRYGISDQLDQSQRAALEKVMVDIGHGRSRSVLNLVAGWASHVTRIFSDRDLSPDDSDDVWTAHDYVAALIIRDMVACGLDQLDEDQRGSTVQVVERFDELFRSFTEHDDVGILTAFAEGESGDGWWWQRVPSSGPIHAELESFARRLGRPESGDERARPR